MPRDPNQVGTIWINEGKGPKGQGKEFFGGLLFPCPPGPVYLVPFEFQRQDGTSGKGWNVIKADDNSQQEEPPAHNGRAPF